MGAALFVVIQADDPAAGGASCSLRGVDAVVIGRGAATGARALDEARLRLDLGDGRVSHDHARIEHVLDAWVIADLGSKNGVYVDGERIERRALIDGNWIEIGHTFLRFRTGVAVARSGEAATLLASVETELDRLARVAPAAVPVLLLGETGTGKEFMARELHARSGRDGRLVPVNCGAIPANLVESTLFGHRRGSFSGAIDDQPGAVASAHRGTLLLDEIADLPLAQQPALLRVLQDREVTPVGDSRPRQVDVRFVAATSQDVDALVRAGRFRGDLLARLSGVRVALPPLRERIEDLGVLVAAIAARTTAPRALARDAAWALCRHAWPYNVRELEQALTGALALAPDGVIALEQLPDAVRASPRPAGDARAELLACLREHGGNLAAVARALGTSRSQVHRLLKRYGIEPLR